MGLSFAIPIDVALNVSRQLKAKGRVVRGWLGVRIQDVTRELAESFGMDKPRGALVSQVIVGSPAEKAGVRVGDVIIAFNGQVVDRSSTLPPLVGTARVSSTAKLKLIRQKQLKTLSVKLESLPDDEKPISLSVTQPELDHILGLLLRELTAEMRQQLAIKQGGVLVQSVTTGVAKKSGIRPGDIILQFGGETVTSVQQFKSLAEKLSADKFISLLINRQGSPIFLALKK